MKINATTASTDELLEAVTDRHRRALLTYLSEHDRSGVSIDELIGGIHDASDGDAPSVDPEALRIRLQHAHLPKLAEIGVVDYDHRTQTVRYHGHERLERLLAFLDAEFD